MESFLNQIIFSLNGTAITYGKVIAVFSIGIISGLFYFYGVKKALNYYTNKERLNKITNNRLSKLIASCLVLIFLIITFDIFRLNQDLYPNRYFSLSWVSIVRGLLIIQFSRLLSLFLSKAINRYYKRPLTVEEDDISLEEITKRDSNKLASNSVSIAVFLFALFLFLQNFQFDPVVFTFYANRANPTNLNISTILSILLVLTIGRVFIWMVTQLILLTYYQKNKINLGTQFAINQLISYFVYVIVILTALHFLAINMTVIWGGLAALLVGVGLGLQQTFNDLFSGLLLLFERGIEVGEIIEIDGVIGSVKRIGLRTSIIESRDNITVIVPNSKLVVNNVINWNHYDKKVRFRIKVGVAYGSDTQLVKKILLESANKHTAILQSPIPQVRFADFGNSSLDFELLFFSKRFMTIEDVKSDLRFEIDQRFRAENIEIPFPQRDLWIRNKGGEGIDL